MHSEKLYSATSYARKYIQAIHESCLQSPHQTTLIEFITVKVELEFEPSFVKLANILQSPANKR